MMSTRKKKKIKKIFRLLKIFFPSCGPGKSRTIVRVQARGGESPRRMEEHRGQTKGGLNDVPIQARGQPRSRTIVLSRPDAHIAVSVYAYVFPYELLLPGPDPEQLYVSRGPDPRRPRAPSENSLRKPAETLARGPEKARFRPRTRTNLRLQGPEQAPKTASSPRAGCVVLFYRIPCIIHYILWFMFDNVYIWCYVHHARLSQTLEFSQFIGNLFFCLCCNIFLDNVLLTDK